MTIADAVTLLHSYGYRANASTLYPGHVVVLDPVLTLPTSENPARVEYERRTVRLDQVYRFITERN